MTMPVPTATISDSLRQAIERLRATLSAKLIDLSRNNPLLYYRDLKVGRLELPAPDSAALAALLAGESLTRSQLSPATASAPAAQEPDPLTTRLTAIRRKARENEEERGLRTLFAGIGMISWRADDGGRDPLAIAILVPVDIVPDPRTRGEFVVRRFDGADATLNPALLEALPQVVSQRLRAATAASGIDDVATGLATIRAIVADYPELSFHDRAVLGNFSFQLMSMVDDLAESSDLLAAHSLVRAIAGDEASQGELQRSRTGVVDVEELDAIPPSGELFVLDADPWQSQAIHTLGRDEVAHAIVDGPPGTGKSQTIANLIASLVSERKTVLFVAEKRAALDVVRKRLTEAGLGSLVLDLHGSDVTRRQAYGQLLGSMRALRAAAPSHFESDDRAFVDRRTQLNDHCTFQNTPLDGIGRTPYEILGRLAHLGDAPAVDAHLSSDVLEIVTPAVMTDTNERLSELADRIADLEARNAVLWASATFDNDDAATATQRSVRDLRDRGLTPLEAEISRVFGAAAQTLADVLSLAGEIATLSELASFFRPDAFRLDDATLDLAMAANRSPFSPIARFFDGSLKAAHRKVVPTLVTPNAARTDLLAKMTQLRAIDRARRNAASAQTLPDPIVTRQTIALVRAEAARIEAVLGPLPLDVPGLHTRLDGLLADSRAPYIAARVRAIEALLASRGLGPFLASLRRLGPPRNAWPAAFERTYLESHLDRIRGRIATFDGRAHDRTVVEFGSRDRGRLSAAGGRVLRAAAERFATVADTYPAELTALEVETGKQRKLKPLRDLFESAPHVLTAVAPCVMASPLSVSQFLPRTAAFDFVVFDEGSQVTPENAVTSIIRGRRLVVAGDRHQLPPTAFFTAVSEDDGADADEGDANTLEGMQSLLDAVQPFAKPLGLRVHYRSRDEKLIAFSNHHVYDDRLVTFPGTGRDGKAVSYEHVPPSATEADETSSAAEVRAVVARVLEHAEHRAHESLGVIAMSIKHAQRIAVELDRVRRNRPDLDAFFAENRADAFFVKNLERVQGDERDAIILSIGYGRTKTGAVSHNFGPVNVSGGERRLNVAITRAKNRILLISQLRASDLDPKRLTSRGAKLLGAYLRYAESGGEDLGRDRPHDEIALNDFEADIKLALESAHGWSIVSQYGVGEFRIDLAVQDPEEPGTFVLAIECDGASYHSSPTARLRDRLRQQILEARGWHFLRIWSTDWFNDRAGEIARAKSFYDAARVESEAPSAPATAPAAFPQRPAASPITQTYDSINDVPMETLVALVRWICSDERIRTHDEIVGEAIRSLGFARRGKAIVARLTAAIEMCRGAG